MMNEPIPIKYTDASQESDSVQKVAAEIMKVLTPNEEIFYIAMQGNSAMSVKKDGIAVTSNRIVMYRPGLLGKVKFADIHWRDVQSVTFKQGMVSSEITVETLEGDKESIGSIDKDQAKRFYGIARQLEEDWQEKRRLREMEENKAKASNVVIGMAEGTAVSLPDSALQTEDPLAKLEKAKAMLDRGLITEAEYEALKTKILASM